MRLQYEVAPNTCWHFIANAISKSTVAMILFPEFPTSYICSHLICSTTDQKSLLATLLDKKCNKFSRTLLSFSWSGKKINRAFVPLLKQQLPCYQMQNLGWSQSWIGSSPPDLIQPAFLSKSVACVVAFIKVLWSIPWWDSTEKLGRVQGIQPWKHIFTTVQSVQNALETVNWRLWIVVLHTANIKPRHLKQSCKFLHFGPELHNLTVGLQPFSELSLQLWSPL